MPKRHRSIVGDWESIFGRLQELVLANSGEDEFQEIFKLVVAKLYAEQQLGAPDRFGVAPTPAETATRVNALMAEAARRWPGILADEPRSRLADEHLHVCVDALEGHALLDAGFEVMDNAFEFLISHTAKGSKGQYFTPRHVVDACVRILKPKQGEVIVDPACGSGGFLLHSMQYALARGGNEHSAAGYAQQSLWGFDFDVRAVEVARALMLLAGDGQSNVLRLNSLFTPDSLTQLDDDVPQMTIEDVLRTRAGNFTGFDAVLTNPPFAGEVREPALLDSYDTSRGGRRVERDVLFLERCVRLLKPGGRLGIVLPHNKLGALQWTSVREWLLSRMRVVAVLGLGRHTFLPHTAQKASVLFAEKRSAVVSPLPDDGILFLISEQDGKDSRGRIVVRDGGDGSAALWDRADHDLADCVEAFDEFAAAQGLAAWSEA
jgi:type I restriction enzyme M protein